LRRYLTLWTELLAMSWRQQPRLTLGLFAVEIGALVAAIGISTGTGAVVDRAASASAGWAVGGAVAVALISTIDAVVRGLSQSLVFRAVSQISDARVDPQIVTDLATIDTIEHLERGDVLARVTILRHAAWGVVASGWSAVHAIFTLVRLVAVLLVLGWVSPWLLALVPMAFVPLWCDRRGQKVVAVAETETAEAFALQRHLFDLATSASAGKELRVTGAADELARRQRAAWDEAMFPRHRAQSRAARLRMAGWSVFVLGFVGCLAAAIRSSGSGPSVAGQVLLAVTAAATLQQSVGAAIFQVAGSLNAGRLIDPYLWLREYAVEQRPAGATGRSAPDVLRSGISLRDVHFTYAGTNRPALDSITADLPAGSVVAIVGEYGSGKTTLVKLLGKFYRPAGGSITVDEVDLTELDTAGWRARTSMAFQDFGRYPQTTVTESVGMGDLPHLDDPERVAQAVQAADGEAFIKRLPDGPSTRLGRTYGGVDLSEGQWQKVALARASMRADPLLFVLDEPTASIDAPSEHQIVERYVARARDLARRTGAVTVVITHRFSTVASADLILVLDKGRLIESGTHEELMATGGRYRTLYEMQAKAYQPA
jgi:ATP-binding cassette subfamily B protein